jgi:hypothetical protein
MNSGARSPVRQLRRTIALAGLAFLAQSLSGPATAQLGPIQHDGFLEYQFRLNRSEDGPGFNTNLATWRAHASTFVWQPYILQLDGSLGLTRGRDANSDNSQKSSFVTGGIFANLFPRSHFPFRTFFEARDSRVDGGVFDRDRVTRTWGFLQQYSPNRGGRLSIDFRQADTDELYEDGLRAPRQFVSNIWQVNGSKSLGRNEFRLLTTFRDISRTEQMQSEKRNTLNLRHRFRTSPRFFIEDTTFFSDERIALDGNDTHRRFLQFNGMSTWRPQTQRPLLVIGRVLAHGIDAGPSGFESGSTNFILTGSANYQFTPQVTIAGNVGASTMDPDDLPDESSVFQRLRGIYRADSFDLGRMQYTWGGALEVGNRRQRTNGKDSVQDVAGNFNHSLSRNVTLTGGKQLQVSFSQQAAAIRDTDDLREQSLVHSIFLTLNRQNGRASSYLRLSASDRRGFGDKDDVFQLVTLQGSSRMQVSRNRSCNGGVTLQYNNRSAEMWDEEKRDDSSFTYSVNLSYIERDLFKVPNLNFFSEMRLLSSDFRSSDILDQGIGVDPDRDDKSWRNRLDYRIGRLELQLLADVREINNRWASQVFFSVRRYYGSI